MPTYTQVQGAINQAQPKAFAGGTNLLHGDKGPKSVNAACDFSATSIPTTGFYFDPTNFLQAGYFKTVQTIYIDNSGNNGPVTVNNPQFNQAFTLPAGWQGYFPCIAPVMSGGAFFITSSGTGIANVQFINVTMGLAQWAATAAPSNPGVTQPVSDAILDGTVSAGRQNTRTLAAQFTAVDRSGAIVTGNVSQTLMAANAARQGFLIQNLDTTGEALWVNVVGGAAAANTIGSFSIGPGSSVQFVGGSFQGVVSNAINVVAATATHKYSAIEW